MKLIKNSTKPETGDENNSLKYLAVSFHARKYYSIFSKPLKMCQVKQPVALP